MNNQQINLENELVKSEASAKWYVVETNTHQERLAAFHLREAGFETYLPMRASKSKRADASPITPFFPNYLFIAVDEAHPRWSAAFSAIGVRTLLRNGDKPAPAPRGLIDEIKASEVFGVVQQTAPKAPAEPLHKRGDKVRIATGQFEGFDAIFVDMPDRQRVHVLLALFGRQSRVTLPHSAIKSAS